MDMWETIAQCCQYHHERWDGTGYPFGLKEEEIPWCARVIAIADTFNAMTAERPYREKMPYEAAVREIRCQAGKQFDPTLAHFFCEAIQCHFRAVI